jgi:hypothetical protein
MSGAVDALNVPGILNAPAARPRHWISPPDSSRRATEGREWSRSLFQSETVWCYRFGRMQIQTGRLWLRPYAEADIPAALAVLGDRETMSFYPQPYSEEQVAAILRI